MSSLDFIFSARAVAIVGASQDPTKRGYQAVRALLESGYAGQIHPVHPKGGTLLGLPVTTRIEALEPVPDLALICTPGASAPEMVRACGARGIRGAVVLALGVDEPALTRAATEAGVRVVGPNTSGILNLTIGLNLIGARGARAGSIALLLQSGNMALSLLNETAAGRREGISTCIGAGNQADLGMADYLRHLDTDPNTRAIAMYVESIQDGRGFFDAARACAKPIVLLKGGRSDAGAASALSHTNALAGEYAVMRAALRQAGVIEVQRTDELFAVAETLALQPRARADIAILSDGGGHATLAADALSELGTPLATLSPETTARLRQLLGPNASINNPVDMANAPDAAPLVFGPALQALLDDPAVGGVLVAGLFGGYGIRFAESLAGQEAAAASIMALAARAAGKPLVVHSLYANHDTTALRSLHEQRVPVFASLDVACRSIAAAHMGAPSRRNPPQPETLHSKALLEPEARALLESMGVPVVPGRVCRSEEEARQAVAALGPCAFKIIARSIVHKSDVGGVRLGVDSAPAAGPAFRELMALAPDTEAVLATQLLDAPVAEVLVGVRWDSYFGPVLAIGVGGTLVEVHRDLALRLLPVTADEVAAMLDETAVGRLLDGVRGRPAGDHRALIDLALRLAEGSMATPGLTAPALAAIEINPVFVFPRGAVAVDARAIPTGES